MLEYQLSCRDFLRPQSSQLPDSWTRCRCQASHQSDTSASGFDKTWNNSVYKYKYKYKYKTWHNSVLLNFCCWYFIFEMPSLKLDTQVKANTITLECLKCKSNKKRRNMNLIITLNQSSWDITMREPRNIQEVYMEENAKWSNIEVRSLGPLRGPTSSLRPFGPA